MSEIAEIGGIATTLASLFAAIFLPYLKINATKKHNEIVQRFDLFEIKNNTEHQSIEEKLDLLKKRETVRSELDDILNSSIAYTTEHIKLNTFKTSFTDSIRLLIDSTLVTGFSNLDKTKFEALMHVSGNQIKSQFKKLPEKFQKITDPEIYDLSKKYFDEIIKIIEDPIFNDKDKRFINLSEKFLMDELMLITKQWWSYVAETKC